MRQAPHVERRMLGCRDDLAHGDITRVPSQDVAAVRAAYTRHDSSAAHAKQDLFDVVRGKPLLRGNLAAGDRAIPESTGEVERADKAVLGPGRDAHRIKTS